MLRLNFTPATIFCFSQTITPFLQIEQQRRAWEVELDAQLKRAAIAHAEHLERVIKTQKQIHDVENEQLVQVVVEG